MQHVTLYLSPSKWPIYYDDVSLHLYNQFGQTKQLPTYPPGRWHLCSTMFMYLTIRQLDTLPLMVFLQQDPERPMPMPFQLVHVQYGIAMSDVWASDQQQITLQTNDSCPLTKLNFSMSGLSLTVVTLEKIAG